MGTEAAPDLHSKISNRDVITELAGLVRRFRKGDFNYSYYRPLVRLAIQEASDLEIWSAVLDLIGTVTRATPPESIPATFDNTPITHSSASQQGTEQTREVVERKVFEEIRFCTYRDVEGFFEKYFEGRTWTSHALGIYEAMKDQHVDGAWTGLPNPPVQDGVLDWWFRFQDVFLSEKRRRYYSTTNPKDLVGAEAQRQIDLFVKRKNGQPPDAAHDWSDVEIGRYVRDVFSCQPTRRPGAFDIHDKPKRFIQVIAGYAMMNDEELGLDRFTELDGNSRLIHVDQDGASARKRLRLESQPFTRQRAVVCRGTSCYLTKPPDSEDWSYVVKFSWTSDRRKPEADLLRLARQRGVEGLPRTTSTVSQSFSRSQPPSALSRKRKSSQRQNEVAYDVEGAQGTSLLASNNGPYDNRVFRCLVISPAGRAIHKYETKSELLGALRDAIKAHRSLHLKGNILHRDISENNIIITDRKTTGHMGMLIDLDLAKELGSGRSGARCRTGTMEFMAVEVLQGISHTYRHDLESFFYVLLWLYREIASAKRGELRGILFPYRDGLFVGTPKDPEILYGPIIKAFDKAIDEIKAMEV
ncbi:kinase [Hirsutella rhossiliensis]|uniref:EKC/KEOPS complex subunit BUD32 n=1 Tax=Hirsutella rhossiliensis TaxID=111463 RepID=A0A9P8N6Y5_9HYPO|nr:kinase [Hirsutella rhossiliensis]KAH0968117.1 kinase [Hirsutella rhossiliensis]